MGRLIITWPLVLALTVATFRGSDSAAVLNNITEEPTSLAKAPCQRVNDSLLECEKLHSLVDLEFPQDLLGQVTTISVRHGEMEEWSRDLLTDFPKLHTLIFKRSFFPTWKIPELSNIPNVSKLVLEECWNNMTIGRANDMYPIVLTGEVLAGLKGLQELHLVNCNVHMLNLSVVEENTPLALFNIEGGTVNCEPGNMALRERTLASNATYTSVITNTTKCLVLYSDINVFSPQYSFGDQSFLRCMEYRKETMDNCPSLCNCSMNGFKDNHPFVQVHCTNQGLTRIPDVIPPYTVRLNLNNNSLKNIDDIFTNKNYRGLDSIMVSHNQISSINGPLLYNYLHGRSLDMYFDLSSNKLKTIPAAELNMVYKEGRSSKQMYFPVLRLSDNPYSCNCSFLPDFKELLYYETSHIFDYSEIRCSPDSSIFGGQLLAMADVVTECSPGPPLLGTIDIINICLALLLLLLITNFLHNLYQYRRHGKLPWIIMCLPCC